MTRLILIAWLLLCAYSNGATHYVDGAAIGANNGTSWTDAWTSVLSGLSASSGDTVYISGGSTSQTYTNMKAGQDWDAGATFQTGQEAGHNGLVIFDGTWVTSGYQWMNNLASSTTWSGFVAGSTNRHMQVTNYPLAVIGDNSADIVLRYIAFSCPLRFFTSTGIELDHLYIRANPYDSYVTTWGGTPASGSGFGLTKIHHCVFLAPNKADGTGIGSDTIQNLTGADIYNNDFLTYGDTNYAGGQHQDAIQSQLSFCRIYNNRFVGQANYSVYGNFIGSADAVLVFGNLFVRTEESSGQTAVAMGPGPGSTPVTFTNVIVAYNTCVDHTGREVIGMGGSVSTTGTWTNSWCVGNLVYNCTPGASPILNTNLGIAQTGVTNASNLAVSGPQGGTGIIPPNIIPPNGSGTLAFASYAEFAGLANNYAIRTNAYTGSNIVAVLHAFQLTNLSSIDGVNWDNNTSPYVGAYQVLSSPVVPAITLGPGMTLGSGISVW